LHVVFCTCPPEHAPDLARKLVEKKLAACVNLIPGVRSFYHWEGELQDDREDLLVLKTGEAALPRLLRELPNLHPYEVPEVLALEVAEGYPPYLSWVEAQTG
jgi:periplasmic divalent cation tolerance protein